MGPVRKNKRLLSLIFLFTLGGTLLFMGLAPRQSECYVECSPVIGVTNYQYFSTLLKSIVKDRFITELKLHVLGKLNIELMPGNFMSSLTSDLEGITDFSSIAGRIVDEGLASQMDYVKSQMCTEAFRDYLNNAVRTVVRGGLLQKGLDGRQVQGFVNDYERQFLNSSQVLGTYAGQARGFQAMAGKLMPESSKFVSGITGLAGKIDVAEWVHGKQGVGGNANTMEMLKECESHTQNSLKNIAAIAGIDMGEAIGGTFCSANTQYLKDKLEKIRSIDGRAFLSVEDIEKIVANTNKAAVRTVTDYLALTTSNLSDMAIKTNAALSRKMKHGIGSADSIINTAMSSEKEKNHAVNQIYAGIEKEVKDLIGDPKQWEAIAREKKQMSLSDNGSIQKITALLAGRNSSALQRKLAVKHYIVARESMEVVAAIKTRLLRFDPGVIDRQYEDMAWKDLARLNYYLFIIHNQKLKLLALRAMTESFNTGDPVVVGYIEKSGLPQGF